LELEEFLAQASSVSGLSGNEAEIAAFMQRQFEPVCDETHIDKMYNMTGVLRGEGGGAKILVCAHLDEVGLIVTGVEEDGSLRLHTIGVDPRILPSSEVRVLCDPPLLGVIGAKPPHILSAEERKKNYRREDLFIDVGLPAQEVRERVGVGTLVQLTGPFTRLLNNRAAGKTFDDRACCAMMLLAAQELSRRRHKADIYFCCSAQEEVGSAGALTAAYRIDPDMAIAIDVTHAHTPGTKPDDTHPLDTPCFTVGPNIHPKLSKMILEEARRIGVKTEISACPGDTCTDAWCLQTARAGVPTALMELPLKYMHTTVEVISLDVLREQARLLASFLAGVGEDWEEKLCY
jgi:putative aminopeptidase FrvX